MKRKVLSGIDSGRGSQNETASLARGRPPPVQNDSAASQGPGRSLRARLTVWQAGCTGWEDHVRHKTARVHHAPWRRGSRVAARYAPAEAAMLVIGFLNGASP